MKNYNHIVDRHIVKWGSFGKSGTGPVVYTLIKDLSNDHLNNIITHIESRKLIGDAPILQLMIQEKQYRYDRNINIPDYLENK